VVGRSRYVALHDGWYGIEVGWLMVVVCCWCSCMSARSKARCWSMAYFRRPPCGLSHEDTVSLLSLTSWYVSEIGSNKYHVASINQIDLDWIGLDWIGLDWTGWSTACSQ
jgi:hypothetical protein